MIKNKHILFLLVITVVAFLLRFYKIAQFPSFHGDEVDFANNAWSILQTGRDQDGNFWPIATTSIGDLRPAVYMYLSMISIAIFGFNEFATRLPAVIFGSLTTIPMYLLARDLLKDKKIALISILLLAVSFWHITLSREASEKTVALFFVILGIWLLYRYLTNKKLINIFVAFVALFISTHTYYSPRLFLLCFLPIILLLFWQKKRPQTNLIPILFTVFFCSVTIFFTFFYGNSRERINQLSVFSNPYSSAILGEQIREDGVAGKVTLTRLFHNKITSFTLTTITNYFDYFSPKFWFIEGGYPQRVRVPNVGLVNFAEIPFILIGLYLLIGNFIKTKRPAILLILAWLPVAFIPAAFTFDEVPNIYRTLLGLPPIAIICAYGVVRTFNFFSKNKWFVVGLVAILACYSWFFAYYLHQYYVHFEYHRPWYRNFAHKILAQEISKNYSDAKIIFVPQVYGGVEAMMRFYFKFDPAAYHKDSLTMDKKSQHFLNMVFVAEKCPYPQLLESGQYVNSPDYIFVNSPECRQEIMKTNPDFKPDGVLYWKDLNPAFEIIKGKNEANISDTSPI